MGLTLIGWVHSHPTWDAFFSSKDMHTQYIIQQLLTYAVGLVMDQHHEFNTFRLTEKGMRDIAKRSLSGFHPHDDAETLYEPVRVIEFKTGQWNSGYIVHENETTMEDDVRAAAARDIHRKSEVQLQSGAATVDLTEGDTNTDACQVPPCPAMAADLAASITWGQRS